MILWYYRNLLLNIGPIKASRTVFFQGFCSHDGNYDDIDDFFGGGGTRQIHSCFGQALEQRAVGVAASQLALLSPLCRAAEPSHGLALSAGQYGFGAGGSSWSCPP